MTGGIDPESALVAYLATWPGLADVAARVYPRVAAQGAPLPRIVYLRVSTTLSDTQDGPELVQSAEFQFDVYAARYLDAVRLGRALQDALAAVSRSGRLIAAAVRNVFDGPPAPAPGAEQDASRRTVEATVWSV